MLLKQNLSNHMNGVDFIIAYSKLTLIDDNEHCFPLVWHYFLLPLRNANEMMYLSTFWSIRSSGSRVNMDWFWNTLSNDLAVVIVATKESFGAMYFCPLYIAQMLLSIWFSTFSLYRLFSLSSQKNKYRRCSERQYSFSIWHITNDLGLILVFFSFFCSVIN